MSEIVISKERYNKQSQELENLDIKGCNCEKDRTNTKNKGRIKIDKEKFLKFKNLWENLNRDAIVKYDIDSSELIKKAVAKINSNFTIGSLDIVIRRDKNIEDIKSHNSSQETIKLETHSIFTIYEFITRLSNNTKLTVQTIATILQKIDKDKFSLIAQNENLALKKIEEQLIGAIYELIINKISYDIKSIEVKNTSLTSNGIVKEFINTGSLGRDRHKLIAI